MDTNFIRLNGIGPYEYSEVKSTEVMVLFNSETKNYVLYLTSEEYGPVIVDSDLESAKNKFINAFGCMLTFRSLMSLPESRATVKTHFASQHNFVTITPTTVVSDISKIADKANKKFAEMKSEVCAA